MALGSRAAYPTPAELLKVRIRLGSDGFDGDDLLRPAVLDSLKRTASANVRLGSRLRVF